MEIPKGRTVSRGEILVRKGAGGDSGIFGEGMGSGERFTPHQKEPERAKIDKRNQVPAFSLRKGKRRTVQHKDAKGGELGERKEETQSFGRAQWLQDGATVVMPAAAHTKNTKFPRKIVKESGSSAQGPGVCRQVVRVRSEAMVDFPRHGGEVPVGLHGRKQDTVQRGNTGRCLTSLVERLSLVERGAVNGQ